MYELEMAQTRVCRRIRDAKKIRRGQLAFNIYFHTGPGSRISRRRRHRD